ncbi:MAG: hypothetical protein GY780_02520 [bacterium]|nr:hypothetical protein [bacterium]
MLNKSPLNRIILLVATAIMMLVLATGAFAKEPESFKEALALAKAQNKMLVIDFYTDW